jgi:hypothetical protein
MLVTVLTKIQLWSARPCSYDSQKVILVGKGVGAQVCSWVFSQRVETGMKVRILVPSRA